MAAQKHQPPSVKQPIIAACVYFYAVYCRHDTIIRSDFKVGLEGEGVAVEPWQAAHSPPVHVCLPQFAMDTFAVEDEVPSTRKLIRMVMRTSTMEHPSYRVAGRSPLVPPSPLNQHQATRARSRQTAVAPDDFFVEDTPMKRLRQLLQRYCHTQSACQPSVDGDAW